MGQGIIQQTLEESVKESVENQSKRPAAIAGK
jgi:hypothetical protein